MNFAPRTGPSGRRLACERTAVVCASLASLLAGARAHADDPAWTQATAPPVTVEVEPSPDAEGCPDAQEIAARIAELGQRAGAQEPATPLSVRFERTEDGLAATLRLGDDARARRLELQDGECAASGEAIAVAGAILVEEAMQEREAAGRAQTPAVVPPSTEPAPAAVDTELPPALRGAPAAQEEREVGAWLALIAAPTYGVLSGLGGAGSLRLELTWKRALLAGGAFATVPSAEAVGAGEIATWIVGAEFSGCARAWRFSASGELALCGLFSVAHLDVQAHGFTQSLAEELAWYAVGATARVHGMLMSPLLGWYAGLSGIVPLQRDVLTVVGAGTMRSRPVGLRAELGVRCAID